MSSEGGAPSGEYVFARPSLKALSRARVGEGRRALARQPALVWLGDVWAALGPHVGWCWAHVGGAGAACGVV
jgi:hypothetical protein